MNRCGTMCWVISATVIAAFTSLIAVSLGCGSNGDPSRGGLDWSPEKAEQRQRELAEQAKDAEQRDATARALTPALRADKERISSQLITLQQLIEQSDRDAQAALLKSTDSSIADMIKARRDELANIRRQTELLRQAQSGVGANDEAQVREGTRRLDVLSKDIERLRSQIRLLAAQS